MKDMLKTSWNQKLGVAATCLLLAPGISNGALEAANSNTEVFPSGIPNGNNVPVVNIGATNSAGVSHNKFNHYDVDSRGLVLNNTSPNVRSSYQSQLAGALTPNPKLTNKAEASVIINEVVAANRSSLKGYTEVAGKKADVIVANPYGITCSGCGFINTDRVTMTTGVPTFSNGALSGFDVARGNVTIEGQGADLTNQQIFDIVARSANINGPIYGILNSTGVLDLRITTGPNQYSYDNRAVSGSTTVVDSNIEAAPTYAIDTIAVGGMYAKTIKLVATEAGVGVRMLGDAAATISDFTLNADGKITMNSNAISAARDIAVTSTSTGNDAIALTNVQLTATRDIGLTASSGGATLSGGVYKATRNINYTLGTLTDTNSDAVISGNNTRKADRNMTISTTGAASLTGTEMTTGSAAAGVFIGSFGSLSLSEAYWRSEGSMSLTSTAGNIALNEADVSSSGSLTMTASGSITSLSADDKIKSNIGNILMTSTGFTNAGTVEATGTVTLRVNGTLTNTGNLHSVGAMTITDRDQNANGTQDINNSGKILSDDTLLVRADELTNSANMQGTKQTDILVDTLTNTSTAKLIASTIADEAGTLTIRSALDNQGVLQSAGDLTLTGNMTTLGNSGVNGKIFSSKTLTISATSAAVTNSANIQGTTKTTLTATSMNNSGTWIAANTNGETATFSLSNSFTNTGTLQSAYNLTLSGNMTTASNTGANGKILVSNAMVFNASNAAVTNSGIWQALGANTTFTAASLNNSGTLTASNTSGQTSTFNLNSLTNSGTLQSASHVTLNLLNTLSNSNKILATQNLTIRGSNSATTAAFSNTGSGVIQAGSTLTMSGQGGGQNATLTTASGTTVLGDALDLDLTALSNSGTIQGTAGNSDINISGTLTNAANAKLILTTSSSAGSGTITADTLDNSGTLQSSRALAINIAAALSNASGATLLGTNNVTIRGTDSAYVVSNSGVMQSDGAMDIKGQSGGNGVSITLSTGATLLGNTMLLNTGTLSVGNNAMVSSVGNMTIDAATLSYGGSGAGIVAASGNTGTGTITLSNSFSNPGFIHSNDNLTLSAPGITNTSDGGISALDTLSISVTGNILNEDEGALYAQSAMVLNADGNITNAAGGTIDSSGTLTTTSNNFTNNGAILAAGNISITASSSFTNETILGQGVSITKSLGGVENTGDTSENQFSSEYGGFNDEGMNAWLRWQSYTRDDQLNGITSGELASLTKAQIISSDTLTVNYGNSGENYIALLSAPTINIGGTGTFTNESLALYRYSETRYWIKIVDERPAANDYFRFWARTSSSASHNTNISGDNENYDTYNPGAGWQATDTVSGGDYSGAGAGPKEAEAMSNALSGSSLTGVARISAFGAGIYATTFNFTSGTLNNVGALHPNANLENTLGTSSGANVSSDDRDREGASGGSTQNPIGTSQGSDTTGTASPLSASSTISFAGITIRLPTNPNGYFVPAQNPNSRYLIETNQRFQVGNNTVSSDYLAQQYGYDPDTIGRRLGDANYEAKLVREQLINQTGNNILKGYQNEAAQMQRLMDQGAAEAKRLGFTWGQAPTPKQLANLQQDVVWMVEVTVNGQKVLAPVVYLAASTKQSIEDTLGGANIIASNANINADAVNNTGGNIVGSDNLNIVSKGDVTNLSGTIKGGNVSVTSTEGNIVNKTHSSGSGNDQFYDTVIGKTATIESTGNLNLDAKKDITNIGANINAGGNATLAAGNNITFDTIEDKTTRSTSSMESGLFSSSSTKTTETTVNQVKSGLNVGGNLNASAKNDITFAGTDIEVGGNANLDAGNDVNFLARANTKTTNTSSSESGLGVGGGVYGTSTTDTETFSSRNVGNTMKVGGDASITAKNDITIEGSKLDVQGSGNLDAGNNINVLAGKDADYTKSTTTTTTFLKIDSGSGESSASSESDSQSKSKNGASSARASAGAEAHSSSSGGLKFSEATTTETETTDIRSVGSSLNFGGNLDVKAGKTVTLQGSDVAAGGDVNVDATDVQVLAAQNVSTSKTTTTVTSVGLMGESDNNAGAGASAGAFANSGNAGGSAKAGSGGAGGRVGANSNLGAGAGAEAGASADSSNKLALVKVETTTTETTDITNTGSSIKSGGNMNINAKNQLKTVGSSLESGGDMDLKAKDMQFLAAQDVHETKTSSSTTSVGLYADGEAAANVGGGGKVGAGGLGGSGGGSAKAGVEGSVGLYGTNTTTNSIEGSTTAVTSSLKSGGNMSRTAENSIKDVGTQIEAGGDFTQTAKEITSEAARDTTYASSSSVTNTAKVGIYGEASAEAEAGGGAATGIGGTVMGGDAKAEANAGYGLKATYENIQEGSSSSSSTAVVSNIKVGGNFSSTSTNKTSMEGTNIEAGGDVNLAAGSLDYKAAANTETSTTTSSTGKGEIKVDANLTGGGAKGGYETATETSSSSTAVVGSIKSGGNLKVTTTGDARFEGTQLEAEGDASLNTGGNLTFDAARNTQSTSSSGWNVSAEVSMSKSSEGSGAGFGVEGGYNQSQSDSSQAVVGGIKSGKNLTVNSGGNATFEGTNLAAGGDASVSAQGDLEFKAARDTESSSAFDVSAGLKVGKESEGESTSEEIEGELSGSYSEYKKSTAVTGSITSGGNLKLSSGGNTTLEGTDLAAGGEASIAAGGDVNFKAAENTESGFSVGGSIAGGSKSTTQAPKSGSDAGTTGDTTGKETNSKADEIKAKAEGAQNTDGGAEAETPGEPNDDYAKNSASFGMSGNTSTTSKTGSIKSGTGIKVTSGGDTTFVGTKLDTKGDTEIAAGGNVSFESAKNSSFGGGVGVTGMNGAAVVDRAEIGGETSNDTASINSGGNLSIKSGGTTTFEGTKATVEGSATIDAAGGVETKSAVGGGATVGLTEVGASVEVESTTIEAKGGTTVNTGAAAGEQVKAVVPIPTNIPEGTKVEIKTADGKPMPSWVKFDPKTGAFTGTPPADFKGSLDLVVKVPQPDGSLKEVPVKIPGN